MIEYKTNYPISTEQFIELLQHTSLGERRPLNEIERIAAMLKNANLLITAWDGEKLVGVARSVTDFAYCCYLSDLAVHQNYQKQGIGKKLIAETQNVLHPAAKIILLSAPTATEYYPHIGFTQHQSAWTKTK